MIVQLRLGHVHERLLPHFYLRRDKRVIAHEMPPKIDMVVFCPLAPRQIEAYQNLVNCDGSYSHFRVNSPRSADHARCAVHHAAK